MTETTERGAWHAVASLDDLWEGDVIEVAAGADTVLLACLPGGEVRAYQGVCPHSEYSLAKGDLDGDVLTCAAHLWEFDLRTGRSVNPEGCRLYEYPVRVRGDRITVSVPDDGHRHYHRCRGRGGTHG
ncbi:toluene monooxygenase system ferredoxin subunit [Actinomadura pelletieri DSM 43383]|uniref:Toluene monooxygenase system ferredoxin subunit n=1 Tax=Actinomadura pelletieri DSM 43383 TaxID=1120940 RepID=A0A495QXB3_9ACTN|nr:Rieske 2Fe-2S domain-containing protein [Actinomadura pelletieri]RKS78707.1 toluene monooxygenase system ferredoxin subunit [Actinomadura pelletieri DSM 43383]